MNIIYSKENAYLLRRRIRRRKKFSFKAFRKKLKKKYVKTVRKFITAASKRSTLLRLFFRRLLHIRRTLRYNKAKKRYDVDEKIILFSAFDGRAYSDSPKAIYLKMLHDPKYSDYKFVWAFRKPRRYALLLENDNTYIVKVNTPGYEEICSRAKYWMFNYRIADHIFPKEDQVYVELWHGTPLKRLGYDIEISDNALNSKAEIRQKF